MRSSDEEFTAFVAASQPALRRTAYLLCGDWHRASDHVQDALIRVYRAWPRLDRGGGLHAYARAAVASVVVDAARRRSASELPVEAVADGIGPGADDARLVDRDLLRRCLATLGPRQRACVVLRHYEDLSVAEVATILGCTEGTVRSQTKRGLEALAQAWASGSGEPLTVATADARSE